MTIKLRRDMNAEYPTNEAFFEVDRKIESAIRHIMAEKSPGIDIKKSSVKGRYDLTRENLGKFSVTYKAKKNEIQDRDHFEVELYETIVLNADFSESKKMLEQYLATNKSYFGLKTNLKDGAEKAYFREKIVNHNQALDEVIEGSWQGRWKRFINPKTLYPIDD